MTDEQPNPVAIMQLGLAFWGAKALLSAIELDLFTTLAHGPLTGETLTAELGLQARGTIDWLDALALRTGQPQSGAIAGQDFLAMYQDRGRLKQFMHAMTGLSMGAALAIAEKFPWDRYRTVIDVGAAEGCVPVQLALRHPQLTGGGFDLPDAGWVFEEYVACHGLADRLQFYPGDFFTDPLPPADVLIMGHILHDWSLEERLALLRTAYRALPDGGAIIVYDAVIDDDRRANAFGLLMSVNMLIETQAGFDYTAADCRSWLTGIGFRDSYVEPLAGPDSMVVGIK